MRSFLAAVLLGTAAAGCSAPATTQITDQLPKDLNVLFWTQDQRDAAFRTMETVPKVVVNTVEAGEAVYPLPAARSEEHTSELQSLMRISYAVFCLKKKNTTSTSTSSPQQF